MQMNRRGIVPLDCNIAQMKWAKENWEDKILGNTPEARAEQKKWAGLLTKAQETGGEEYDRALKKFAGQIINTNIDLMLYTGSIATAMFDVITVTGTDIPAYSLEVTPEIHITRMSGHGYPVHEVKIMSATQYFPQFYLIATPRIYQYRKSILTGNVGPNMKINQRGRYEIDQTIEDDIWTLLMGAVGTFGTDVWVYDNRIQNLPTVNTYDFSAEGGLTKGLFQSILAAVDKIPSRSRPGEAARIRNIFAPSNAIQDMRQWVSVVSSAAGGGVSQDAADSVSPDLQSQMESNGVMLQTMWGEPIGLRKVNRLMGTSQANWEKYLWVFLDGPVGRLLLKTDEDMQDRLTDHLPYEEGFILSRMIAMEIPSPYTPNFMLVKFKP